MVVFQLREQDSGFCFEFWRRTSLIDIAEEEESERDGRNKGKIQIVLFCWLIDT
jgi:hypothetical protein